MFYFTVTAAMLAMVLTTRGLPVSVILTIFAIVAPLAYYAVRVRCRLLEIRAMRNQITDDTP